MCCDHCLTLSCEKCCYCVPFPQTTESESADNKWVAMQPIITDDLVSSKFPCRNDQFKLSIDKDHLLTSLLRRGATSASGIVSPRAISRLPDSTRQSLKCLTHESRCFLCACQGLCSFYKALVEIDCGSHTELQEIDPPYSSNWCDNLRLINPLVVTMPIQGRWFDSHQEPMRASLLSGVVPYSMSETRQKPSCWLKR